MVDQVRRFAFVFLLGLGLTCYAVSALEALPIEVPSVYTFNEIGMDANFSCADEEALEAALASKNASGNVCGGVPGRWCGYKTWQDACWAVALTPAALGVQYDSYITVMAFLSTLIVGWFIFGRGVVRFTSSGKYEISSLKFMATPQMLLAIFCVAINLVISVFHAARLPYSVTAMQQYPGQGATSVPEKVHLPQIFPVRCYGECDALLFDAYAACLGAQPGWIPPQPRTIHTLTLPRAQSFTN